MTDRRLATGLTETAAGPQPGAALALLRAEALARPDSGSGVTHLAPETLARPAPGVGLARAVIEVLRRDTAAAAMVAGALEAFGEAPWPQAPRGVFAFRHDWAEPLVERLEWQTAVTRLASGNEARQALRLVPRRLLTYHVGHGRASDALVADWLADHLGHMALWPLPHRALTLSRPAAQGDDALAVASVSIVAWERPAADLHLTYAGVEDWGDDAWRALVLAPDGWQLAPLDSVEAGTLWLAAPLARAVPVGAAVMPLVWGMASEAADLAQWVPGVAGGRVTASLTPAPLPDMDLPGDPLLDGLPVWPEGNWRDDPSVTAQGMVTRQDLSPADPWVRRDDPWPTTTFQRRYLATGPQNIERWRARLYRAQGRLGACWLPDGLAPVLRVTAEADPGDGFLRVTGEDISAFWHRPAGALILHPDGSRQHVLTATCHRDQGGVLVLRSGLDAAVPAGSRVVRLARCRLDHDAVDLYWHTPALVEIP
ncbi:hypothetical protein LJB71_13290 [Thermomonas sp. S9]|nr:hypothetical protein [Thermomonas sp. S9]MCR6497099.1 hypothetical protein [Thermomonas sp. S9]